MAWLPEMIPIVFIYRADGCHCERSEAIFLPFVFELAAAFFKGLVMTVQRYY
jgi:hypothetical protein